MMNAPLKRLIDADERLSGIRTEYGFKLTGAAANNVEFLLGYRCLILIELYNPGISTWLSYCTAFPLSSLSVASDLI